MASAYRAEATWVDGVRAALFELLASLDARPSQARRLIVDSLAGDARMLAHRRRTLRALARALDADSPGPSRAPFCAEAVVDAIASILQARLLEEPLPPLRDMGGQLMGMIALAYLGTEAAREELSRPLPIARG